MEATPRKGMGSFRFCQQPLQRIGCDAIRSLPDNRERGV
jgi:hypothetical protein